MVPGTGERAHLILIGFMGTGKTVVGRELAHRLGRPFIDTDDLVEKASGMTIAEIFREKGEASFRDKESRAVLHLFEEEPGVVSCGGGVVLRPVNRAALRKAGKVFLLRASAEEIARRLEKDDTRPLLAGEEPRSKKVEDMLEERNTRYLETADHVIETDGREPVEIAAEIEELWRE